MPDNNRIYRIQFKEGKQIDVKASKMEHGNHQGYKILVFTRQDGQVENETYFPVAEILYVAPYDLLVL